MGITLPEFEEYEKPYVHKTKHFRDYFVDWCKISSKKFPFLADKKIKVSKELKDAIEFLKWDLKPFEVVVFSRSVLITSLILLLGANVVGLLLGYFSLIVFVFSASICFLLANTITEYPKNEAHLEKVTALSYAPNILTQIVIYLKQNPNLEKALEFVTEYGDSRIIDELKESLWKSYIGHKKNLKEAIGEIAQKWGDYLTEFKRSIYLIRSAVSEKNEIKRNQTLDKAIEISLEGIINKIKNYTQKLYFPTLFLFSFGTILPLVIISLLPIFSFLGGAFSSPLQMFLVLTVSLFVIYFYSNSILTKRPPAFSTIKLPDFMKDYPKAGNLKLQFGKTSFEANTILYCSAIFLAVSFPGILFLISMLPSVSLYPNFLSEILTGFNTLTIIWGFGLMLTLYFWGTSWYKKKLRSEIEKTEKEMIDGSYQLASRISEGRSPEGTIKHLGDSMPDTSFGNLMRKTGRIISQRHTTIEEALFNKDYGSLKNVYSANLRMVLRIFVNSLKKGVDHCAQTLFTMSNHFDQLKKTEEKLKETLKNSLSMMRMTASIFAPMITGLVVTLQQMIQTGVSSAKEKLGTLGYEYLNLSFLTNPGLSVEMLQLIAGIYMLLLAVLLIRYATLLEYGKDNVMLKTELSKSIPIALFIFTATLIISRVLLG